MCSSAHLAGLMLALALSSACSEPPGGVPREPAPERVPGRPDVVIVTLDTVRADHLGLYGYARDTAPNLSRLAAEAIVFERCLAPVATTLPTHTSLFTGLWPLEHGILANLKGQGRRYTPPAGLARLAEGFRGAGYRTAAFVSALPLRRHFGLAPGFEVYHEPIAMTRPGELTTLLALDWLEEVGTDEPILLWVHYFDPHGPYEPPPPYDARFASDEALERYLAPRRFSETAVRPTGQTNVLRPSINAYDGEIAYADAQLGRLVDRLRERGRWDATVLVVLADHGEGLNQHDAPGHGLTWNEHLHVPWILRFPGVRARRVVELVSVTDVAPTLCGLLELPELDAVRRQASGRDVLAGSGGEVPLLALSSERQAEFGESTLALTGPRWKSILTDGGRLLLFDLERDPFELEDVAERHPDVAESMRRTTLRLAEEQRARGRALEAGGTASLHEEEIEGLRGLGYAGGDDGE